MSYPARNHSITENAGRAELAQQLRFLAQLVEEAKSFEAIVKAMEKEGLTTNRTPTAVHFECFTQQGVYCPPVPEWLGDLLQQFYITSTALECRKAHRLHNEGKI